MKYFIGYLIDGEAATWHNAITKDIAEKFTIWKIYEKGPPHFTIFYPFETENIAPIKAFLQDWVQSVGILEKISISDFGYFDDKAVFATIEVGSTTRAVIKELRERLQQVIGVSEDTFPVWNPHATVAYKLLPEEIKKIWEYVQKLEKPNFVIPFSNITIFRFEDEKHWVVEKSFKIE